MMVLGCRQMALPVVRRLQLGLIGMRERVMAMTGSLTIQHGHMGKGLVLVARLPCVSSLQPQDGGMPE